MPSRFIHKGLGAPDAVSRGVGIGATKDGALQVDFGSGTGVQFLPVNHKVPVLETTTSRTLTAADHGLTVIANTTASVTVQLPATQKGLRYTLVVGQVTGSGGHAFSPVAADKIIGFGSKADDADLVCSAATDVLGNFCTLEGDGVDGWGVVAMGGTWA